MIVNSTKLELAMAHACMNPYDLCGKNNISYQTYRRVANGYNCKPATLGKIAKALNVPVEDLIDLGDGE